MYCLGNKFLGYKGTKNSSAKSVMKVLGDVIDNMEYEGSFDTENPSIVSALLGGRGALLATTIKRYADNLVECGRPVRVVIEDVLSDERILDGYNAIDTGTFLVGVCEQVANVRVLIFKNP